MAARLSLISESAAYIVSRSHSLRPALAAATMLLIFREIILPAFLPFSVSSSGLLYRFCIVLLQVIKRIVPPMSNEIITLVKDTSLARIVMVYEIIWNAQKFAKTDGLLIIQTGNMRPFKPEFSHFICLYAPYATAYFCDKHRKSFKSAFHLYSALQKILTNQQAELL